MTDEQDTFEEVVDNTDITVQDEILTQQKEINRRLGILINVIGVNNDR